MVVLFTWPCETGGGGSGKGLSFKVQDSRNIEPGTSSVGSGGSLMARLRTARLSGQNEAESAHD